jgi:hypothetical protein
MMVKVASLMSKAASHTNKPVRCNCDGDATESRRDQRRSVKDEKLRWIEIVKEMALVFV